MRIDIISVLPELLQSPMQHSIMKRAQEKKLLEVQIHNLRQWAVNEYGQVDDYQYGGGAGMVMMCQPLAKVIEQLSAERKYDEVIYLTPDGEMLDQKIANTLSLKENIIMICGHYKGIDERIREHFVTKEISIGDFVLTGGEIPAMLITDAVTRLLPGVITEGATEDESFSERDGQSLLEYPHYTKPRIYENHEVPQVLLNGDHKKIAEWRKEQAIKITKKVRPDLLNH